MQSLTCAFSFFSPQDLNNYMPTWNILTVQTLERQVQHDLNFRPIAGSVYRHHLPRKFRGVMVDHGEITFSKFALNTILKSPEQQRAPCQEPRQVVGDCDGSGKSDQRTLPRLDFFPHRHWFVRYGYRQSDFRVTAGENTHGNPSDQKRGHTSSDSGPIATSSTPWQHVELVLPG